MVGSARALTVTETGDANTLVNEFLGSGITVTGISYNGAAVASGTFTDGLSSGIGIDEGIILTSGRAGFAVGPNDSDYKTQHNGWGGDPDLEGLIPGYTVNDATVLEFDFESAGGDVYFNYVFASEEYNEWVDSPFNDVFGFFLDGTNIAELPDGTPVTIDTVNKLDNPTLYNNNDPSDGIPPFNIEYDGFTDVLTVSFTGLSAGTHHIKLAVADAGDHVLDSAVFLQAGTFSDVPTDPIDPIPEPSNLLLLGIGLIGVLALGRKKLAKK
jgi:hypothetical protein